MFENPKASCPVDTVYEYNARGKIPYVPVLRAPYYQWIGQRRDCTKQNPVRFPARASDEFEAKRPPAFPSTFLYSLSWEDPREDDKVLDINGDDTVLTLTSGGCNALDLVYQGAGQVVAVDINPAQSYLLELKRVAIIRYDPCLQKTTWILLNC
jgi:betaine lipid synthase